LRLYHLLRTNPDRFYQDPGVTGPWYYTVETEPGKFIGGHDFPSIGLTRHLLRKIDVAGLRCYDVGTMEGLVAALLAKRGAKRVIATDVYDLGAKVQLVQALHDVNFDYHPNIQLDRLVDFIKTKLRIENVYEEDGDLVDPSDYRADLTVISGVLYHVFSPMHLLGYARSLTRRNGLVLVETAALKNADFYMRSNFTGGKYIYDWTDTWFPTLPLLDYMLRLCKLRPLDMAWLPQWQHPELIRVAAVCRAVTEPDAAASETLMAQSTLNVDYNIFVDTYGEPADRPDVPYRRANDGLVLRENGLSCDLYLTALKRPKHVPPPDDLRLRLNAAS
jgi:2-polyprenyl-3-methyl-5-hydroxy-6-metoxy-1,4-benzoquinol methylase